MDESNIRMAARHAGCHVHEINKRTDLVSWEWDVIVDKVDDPEQFEIELPVEVVKISAKSCDDGFARVVLMLEEVEG